MLDGRADCPAFRAAILMSEDREHYERKDITLLRY